jgi:prevent-host-death family protein
VPVLVGAHEYRNRFGWYMQRAAAGESFLITRRGRPHARLVPPDARLELTEGPPDRGPASRGSGGSDPRCR